MKITIPLEALDIMGLLNAAADFRITKGLGRGGSVSLA